MQRRYPAPHPPSWDFKFSFSPLIFSILFNASPRCYWEPISGISSSLVLPPCYYLLLRPDSSPSLLKPSPLP